jgi:hypothetical protein
MKKKDLIQVRSEYTPQLSKLLYNWQIGKLAIKKQGGALIL